MKFNIEALFRVTGCILAVFGLAMLVPFLYSFISGEHETEMLFFWLAVVVTGVGIFVAHMFRGADSTLTIRDGYLIVAVNWILLSLVGALPFCFSGAIPGFANALFECVSGITTTGASVVADVEALPRTILLWRSILQWLGGIGVLIFTMALLPFMGISSGNIAVAEISGPSVEKISPKMSRTAKFILLSYITLTALETVLLCIFDVPVFDSVNHSMTSVSSGGFSTYNDSVAHFASPAVEWTIVLFMFAGGINFGLYHRMLRDGLMAFLRDAEFRCYGLLAVAASFLLTLDISAQAGYTQEREALRDGVFQTVSILTTTGFCSADYDLWPTFAKACLLMLMLVGACAGSTSGAIKVIRIMTLFKLVRQGVMTRLHPSAVVSLRLGNKRMADEKVSAITGFLFLYLAVLTVGCVLVSLNNFDFATTLSAVVACLGNVGHGFGGVGPMMNYACFAWPEKLVLSGLMLLGRLELFTILMLFSRRFWNSDR